MTKFQDISGTAEPVIAMVHIGALPYASDKGPWTPNAGQAMRYRNRLGARDVAMLDNVLAEFAHSLDTRPLADRARSAVFSSIPDAVLVSGQITGEAARMEDLEAVKRAVTDVPVMASTGVKHATIADILRIADGCVVGSALTGPSRIGGAISSPSPAIFWRNRVSTRHPLPASGPAPLAPACCRSTRRDSR